MARVHVFHNIMWSKYKNDIFEELYFQTNSTELQVKFTQIAETELSRMKLGQAVAVYQYPCDVMYEGAYENVSKLVLCVQLFLRVFTSKSEAVVLPGYSNMEHWSMLLAGILCGKRLAVFCDSTIYDRKQGVIKNMLKRFFFSRMTAVLVYGKRSAEYVFSFGVSREKIFSSCSAAAKPSIEIELADVLHGDREGALYVGRLAEEKGLRLLLIAWQMLFLEGDFNMKLRIVGSGPLEVDLKELASTLRIDHLVTFTGPLSGLALAQEYLQAKFLVLPSTSEPWGLVVNEAFYYGCPALVSSICGCVPELINNKTGFVFSVSNVEDLAAKIREAFSCRTNEYSRSCRELIESHSVESAARNMTFGLKYLCE